jgi:MFS family permease
MHLLAPDILTEARGLSAGAAAVGLGVGFLLWLLGWWGHRFWIVLFTTAVAGILGLLSGHSHGVQPLAAGLLLALAAGFLALALVRILAFVAGGAAAWLAVQALAPAWAEPLVCFLAGGLLGVLLFRVWTMALTSLAGTLLMAYSGLCLADRLGKLDAPALTARVPVLLNWACIGVALVGLVAQFIMERRRMRNRRWREQSGRLLARLERERRLRQRPWWNWRKPPVPPLRQAG